MSEDEPTYEEPDQYEQAVADNERLRERLAEAERAIKFAAEALHGYGMADQGEAFDTACRILDAFLEPPR